MQQLQGTITMQIKKYSHFLNYFFLFSVNCRHFILYSWSRN